MQTIDVPPVTPFLKDLMRRKGRLPSQMALDLGVSHTTVMRWLSGEDIPNPMSCHRLSRYSGVGVEEVLALCGHLPSREDGVSIRWPEFRAYPGPKLPADIIVDWLTLIQDVKGRSCSGRTST